MGKKIHIQQETPKVYGMMFLLPTLCGRFGGVVYEMFEDANNTTCKLCLTAQSNIDGSDK